MCNWGSNAGSTAVGSSQHPPISTAHLTSSPKICSISSFSSHKEQAEELLQLWLCPAAQQRPLTGSSHSAHSAASVLPQTAPPEGGTHVLPGLPPDSTTPTSLQGQPHSS